MSNDFADDAEMSSAMARLESQALFAHENYSAALLEGVAALACLEAVHLLESVRSLEFAAQVKDSLEDALGSEDPMKMYDVHSMALSALDIAGIDHNLPESTPPSIPLGLRRSSLRYQPAKLPRSPSLDVSDENILSNVAKKQKCQRTLVDRGAELRLLRRTSIFAWTIVFIGVAGLFAFMSRSFMEQRAAPVVQSQRIMNEQLPMPRLTFCYAVHGFPAVVNGWGGCEIVVEGNKAVGLPCPEGARNPLFAVSRIAASKHDKRDADTSRGQFRVSKRVYSVGTADERESCRRSLQGFDVNVHKEWIIGERWTANPCQTCLQVSSDYFYTSAKHSVSVEIATDNVVQFCFDPANRLDFLSRVVPGLTAHLSDNLESFVAANILNLNGVKSPLEQVPL